MFFIKKFTKLRQILSVMLEVDDPDVKIFINDVDIARLRERAVDYIVLCFIRS